MADVTGTSHRTLLLLDERFTAANLVASGTDEAVYTQAGSHPGSAVASEGAPALATSGSQTRVTDVYASHGGNPGASTFWSTGNTSACEILWRYAGDTYYRGWDPPSSISEFEWLDRSTTANEYLHPHIASTPAGVSYLVVQHLERYVQCWSRGLAGQWSAVGTVYDAGSAVLIDAHACVVVLPSGDMTCIYWDDSAPGLFSATSRDGGATWATPQLVDVALSFYGGFIYRIRAAYSGGQILMLVSASVGADDYVIQFASIDGGQSFTMVSTIVNRDAGYAEVCAAPGGSGFVIATIETVPAAGTTSTTPAYARRVGSAFDFVMTAPRVLVQGVTSAVEWGTQAGTSLTAGELAIAADESGTIWLIGLDWVGGGTRPGIVVRSDDGGATWASAGSDWYESGDSARGLRQMSAAAQGGRLVVAHTISAAVATASLACTYLGGPTTVCQPQSSASIRVSSSARPWTVSYLPFARPENIGATWTAAVGGAPTVSLTGQGLRVQHTGVLDYATWTATPTTTDAQGLLVVADLRCVAGSIEMTIQIASTYAAKVTVTPTGMSVRDVGGAVVRATVADTVTATGVQVKIAVGDDGGGGRFRCWYRPWGSKSDREWTVIIGLSSALTATAASADSVVFGTGTGTATTDAYCRMLQYSEGADTGAAGTQLYLGSGNSQSALLGQPLGPIPYPVAESGLRLAMLGGPTRVGDEWTITPRYHYGIDQIDASQYPSPSATWRSTADGVSQRIVWSLAEAGPMAGPLAALYLDGCNFATAEWCGWDGAAWVVIADIDLRIGVSLKYTRAGAVVYCGTGGGSAITDYVEKNALVRCRIKLGTGQIRVIKGNAGGRWTGAAVATTRPILMLESPDSGDPTTGTTAEIWSPRGATVIRSGLDSYQRYSLHITPQATAEGYYQIGVLMVGALQVLGSPDWSRQLVTETQVQTTQTRSGVRKKRRLGLPRRSAIVSWTDGWDVSGVHDAAPNYVTDYTGGTPIAAPAAIASDIHGTIYANDVLPVVYLPVVPVAASSSAVTSITASDLMLYGTIETDTIQTDVVLGDEHTGGGRGELVRLGSVRMEEVL